MVTSFDIHCCSERQVDPDFEESQPEDGFLVTDSVAKSSKLQVAIFQAIHHLHTSSVVDEKLMSADYYWAALELFVEETIVVEAQQGSIAVVQEDFVIGAQEGFVTVAWEGEEEVGQRFQLNSHAWARLHRVFSLPLLSSVRTPRQ